MRLNRVELLAVVTAAALWASAPSLAVAQAATPSPADAAPPGLAKGDVVPSFNAEGIDGNARSITYGQRPATILLFFLSGCPHCHKMIPLWNAAYERRPKGLEVVGVLLDQEPPGFFIVTPISFPVVRAPGFTPLAKRAFMESFKIRKVPVTLRVGAGGRVEDVGEGPLDLIRLGELFRP